MANGNDQYTKTAAKAVKQNPDTDPIPVGSEGQDTLEGVVRRLLANEGDDGGLVQLAAGQPPAPGKVRGKAQDNVSKSSPVQSMAGRLTAVPKRAVANVLARARDVVLSYRPRPRHIALLLLTVIVLTMPWLIPVLVFLGLILILISYLTLGHDRSSELIANWYIWLARRNPQGAERLRLSAARVSARLSAWAGYLPDRWTSGLYLPEFSHPDEASDKLSGDPFERLAVDTQNH